MCDQLSKLRIEPYGGVKMQEISLPKRIVEGKYFANLKYKVIDSGVCSHCGACAAICPAYGIVVDPSKPIDFPNWEEDCLDCGLCVRICPRWDYDPKSGLGDYLEIFAARSKRFKGQDGGIVTEILAIALEEGMIDRAVVVTKDENWYPKAITITKPEQLEKASGAKYSFAPSMLELRKAVFRSKSGVGFVGTPCMISGLRSLQKLKSFRKVKLAVGLFCMENFYYDQLAKFLADRGIHLRDAVWIGISRGKFIIKLKDEEQSFSVKELNSIVPSGCKVCKDFTAVESDISVGSVGSAEGFSTVIVRTEVGREIAEKLKESCEIGDVNLDLIKKVCKLKAERCER